MQHFPRCNGIIVKRSKSKFLIAALVLVFGVVGIATFFISSEAVSKKRFEQVSFGMPEASVRDLLGIPDRMRHDSPYSTVFFYGGFLRSKWCSMEVNFGADGRVAGKFHDH